LCTFKIPKVTAWLAPIMAESWLALEVQDDWL